MTLNIDQIEALQQAAQPLMDFLRENCHPHTTVIVESESAELVEGIARVKNEKEIPA